MSLLGGLVFLGVLLLVLGPCHWYLWRRLVKDTTRPGRWRKAGAIAFIPLMASLLFAFSRRVRDLAPDFIGDIRLGVSLTGYMWIAVLFYLLLTLAVLEIPRLVAHKALPRAEPAEDSGNVDESRRLLIARSTAIVAGLTATSLVGYGVRTALGPPVLKRVQIPLAKPVQ